MGPQSYICPSCGSEAVVGTPCGLCAKANLPPDSSGSRTGTRGRKRSQGSVRRGWEQTEDYEGLDLPDEAFDYDDFIAREFGNKGRGDVIRIRWYWWVTALLLITTLVLLASAGLW